MKAIDRGVTLSKISSTGAKDSSVTKLTLIYTWMEGDDCDLAVYLCRIAPQVREAIRIADIEDDTPLKFTVSAARVIDDASRPCERDVKIWSVPYYKRIQLPAADGEKALLLAFPNAKIIGDLAFRLKGKTVSLTMTIQIKTEEMVNPDGTEIGLRSLYQLRGSEVWLDIDLPAEEQPGLEMTTEGQQQLDALDGPGEELNGLDGARQCLLGTISVRPKQRQQPEAPEGVLSLGISAVPEDWFGVVNALKTHGDMQPAAAQQVVELIAGGDPQMVAAELQAGDDWALNLVNALHKAGATYHFVTEGQTLDDAASEWARQQCDVVQNVSAQPEQATAAPSVRVETLDGEQLRAMIDDGDIDALRAALVALGNEDIEALRAQYTAVTMNATSSKSVDYIVTKFIAALKKRPAAAV